MTDGQDLDELRAQTDRGDRLEARPEPDVADDPFVKAIGDALRAVEAGDREKVLTVRDAEFTALLDALEADGSRKRRVGDALYGALGREADGPYTNADLLRAALRIGLREGAPGVHEQLADVVAEHARESV